LLGAEEFGFSTSALVTLGCILMRKCHLNTCPVGIATQDEHLREKFYGRADHVVNFFTFVAEEIREYLALLGYRKFDDIIGRTDLLESREDFDHWKLKKVDLKDLVHMPEESKIYKRYYAVAQVSKTDDVLDRDLIKEAEKALVHKEPVIIEKMVKNTDRTVGAMLSGEIAMRHGEEGLPDDTVQCTFRGSAGQSFGAFLASGATFRLEGDSNDYLGKGLSGGKIIVVPGEGSTFKPEENIIIGNTVLYGATRGEVYVKGIAGERFAVRNSGAIAVIEGVGDHGCEYMTGGRVVILGETGRNFAAGMSGGIAYVLDRKGNFDYFCNMGMVELSLVEDMQDAKELKKYIQNHYNYTNSRVAKNILKNWEESLPRFIKVTPFEYKKILEEEKIKHLNKKIEEYGPSHE
jgi:glutamate synthase (NADPH) large chain